MKKKIVSLVLAAVAATSMFGLTACGNKSGDDYDGLKSDKINSAEEWAAAFDFSEVTNVRIASKGMEGPNNEFAMEFDGDKVKMEGIMYDDDGEKEEQTRYELYKEDELFDEQEYPGIGTVYGYVYLEETDEWILDIDPLYRRRTAQAWLDQHINVLEKYDDKKDEWITVAQRYSEFAYDEKSYAYVAELEVDDDYTNITVSMKFENGKLAECVYSGAYAFDAENEHFEVSVWVTDFGNINLVLPTVEE